MLFFIHTGTSNASELIIVPEKDLTPIYDNLAGEFTVVGYLRAGEPIFAVKDFDDDFWQVTFANAHGYVKKEDANLQSEVDVPLKNSQSHSNSIVSIDKDADVFDNSTGALKKVRCCKSRHQISHPI